MTVRKSTPAFEDVVVSQRETMLEQYSRALAGVQGRPPDSEKVDDDDEYEAWTRMDPNVTPENLQQIAMSTVEELKAQTNDDGSPMWSPEQIATEVKMRQKLAQYPFRHLTYTVGTADLDEQIRKAEHVWKRVSARQQREATEKLAAGGWEPMTEMPEQSMPMLPPPQPQGVS